MAVPWGTRPFVILMNTEPAAAAAAAAGGGRAGPKPKKPKKRALFLRFGRCCAIPHCQCLSSPTAHVLSPPVRTELQYMKTSYLAFSTLLLLSRFNRRSYIFSFPGTSRDEVRAMFMFFLAHSLLLF